MSTEYRDRRDAFAAAALQGLLASGRINEVTIDAGMGRAAGEMSERLAIIAAEAWQAADAMIESSRATAKA